MNRRRAQRKRRLLALAAVGVLWALPRPSSAAEYEPLETGRRPFAQGKWSVYEGPWGDEGGTVSRAGPEKKMYFTEAATGARYRVPLLRCSLASGGTKQFRIKRGTKAVALVVSGEYFGLCGAETRATLHGWYGVRSPVLSSDPITTHVNPQTDEARESRLFIVPLDPQLRAGTMISVEPRSSSENNRLADWTSPSTLRLLIAKPR